MEKEIKDLRECLAEAIHLMEDVYAGDYKPDLFTTQPWRKVMGLELITP